MSFPSKSVQEAGTGAMAQAPQLLQAAPLPVDVWVYLTRRQDPSFTIKSPIHDLSRLKLSRVVPRGDVFYDGQKKGVILRNYKVTLDKLLFIELMSDINKPLPLFTAKPIRADDQKGTISHDFSPTIYLKGSFGQVKFKVLVYPDACTRWQGWIKRKEKKYERAEVDLSHLASMTTQQIMDSLTASNAFGVRIREVDQVNTIIFGLNRTFFFHHISSAKALGKVVALSRTNLDPRIKALLSSFMAGFQNKDQDLIDLDLREVAQTAGCDHESDLLILGTLLERSTFLFKTGKLQLLEVLASAGLMMWEVRKSHVLRKKEWHSFGEESSDEEIKKRRLSFQRYHLRMEQKVGELLTFFLGLIDEIITKSDQSAEIDHALQIMIMLLEWVLLAQLSIQPEQERKISAIQSQLDQNRTTNDKFFSTYSQALVNIIQARSSQRDNNRSFYQALFPFISQLEERQPLMINQGMLRVTEACQSALQSSNQFEWVPFLFTLRLAMAVQPTGLFLDGLNHQEVKRKFTSHPRALYGLAMSLGAMMFFSQESEEMKTAACLTLKHILRVNLIGKKGDDIRIGDTDNQRINLCGYIIGLIEKFEERPAEPVNEQGLFARTFTASAPPELKIWRTMEGEAEWREAFAYYHQYRKIREKSTDQAMTALANFLKPGAPHTTVLCMIPRYLDGTSFAERSLFARCLTIELLDDSIERRDYLPIYVPLHRLQNPTGSLMEESLALYGLQGKTQQMDQKKVVWICDGFDKIPFPENQGTLQLKNPYDTNQMHQRNNSRCLFVLPELYSENDFRPHSGKVILQPLTCNYPLSLVEYYVSLETDQGHSGEKWTVEEYKSFYERKPSRPFWELWHEPSFVRMVLQYFPRICKIGDRPYHEGYLEKLNLDLSVSFFVRRAFERVTQAYKRTISFEQFVNYFLDFVGACRQSNKWTFSMRDIKKDPAFSKLVDENQDVSAMRMSFLEYCRGEWQFPLSTVDHWKQISATDALRKFLLEDPYHPI